MLDRVIKIDTDNTRVKYHNRPRVAQNGIDQADNTAAHIDYSQLNHWGHRHRKNDQARADVSEDLKKDLIIVNKKFHKNLQKPYISRENKMADYAKR